MTSDSTKVGGSSPQRRAGSRSVRHALGLPSPGKDVVIVIGLAVVLLLVTMATLGWFVRQSLRETAQVASIRVSRQRFVD